jgi:hypothetical protein
MGKESQILSSKERTRSHFVKYATQSPSFEGCAYLSDDLQTVVGAFETVTRVVTLDELCIALDRGARKVFEGYSPLYSQCPSTDVGCLAARMVMLTLA